MNYTTTRRVPIFLPGDRFGFLTAGPTRALPDDMRLIRCAAEISVSKDRVAIDIATKDFQPFDDDALRRGIAECMTLMDLGVPLYVGCMGGTGRTGTFLAALVAQHPAMSGTDAITYIRQVYRAGAVETTEQGQQVIRMASEPPVVADERTFTEKLRGFFDFFWSGKSKAS